MTEYKKVGQNCGRNSATVTRGAHGRCDVNKYDNELNHKRAQLDNQVTHFGKFDKNRASSFAVLARTDRHIDRQTDTQTTPGFPDPDDHNTFSQ